MRKSLFLLSALLLTGIGAWAQEATYEFKAKGWVSIDANRTADTYISYDESANTITVVSQVGTTNYLNNVALANGSSENGDHSTSSMSVSSDQHWFVVIGTNISLADDANKLWWMNGQGGFNVDPSETATLSDGRVVLAWDLRKNGLNTPMTPAEGSDYITLDGWTGFGLTSSDETTHTSVISEISFYTEDELNELISAQPYTFNAKDWAATNDHASATSVTYGEDGSIIVTASGNLNVALSNSPTAKDGDETIGITTGKYYITQDQTYFVVIGANLSTSTDQSKLWWMNGTNLNGADPTITTLSDGKIVFVWDLSNSLSLPDEKNHFDGWTCFGLTSTTGSSVISDINFYTADEVTAIIEEETHFCTANTDHWTSSDGADFWVDTAEKNDGSGMEPPFLTYYVYEGDGATLQDATFTHETLTLEPGKYKVSMDIRIIDYDEGTIGKGTLFSATTGSTTVSQDIELGVDANEISFNDEGERDDIYGTYKLYVTVADEGSGTGSLSVSLTVKNATYNWIMWKNLTVTAIEEEPTVEWTLGAQYGTLMLPFAADLAEESGLTAYTISSVSNNEVTLSEGTTSIEAGVPYIIGGTASETAITFAGMPTAYNVSYTSEAVSGASLTGVQKQTTAPDGSYVLQLQGEDTTPAFYLVAEEGDAITVGAYHCYLSGDAIPANAKAVRLVFGDDVATAIEAVEATEETAGSDAIYDLSGRRVAKAQKGVYIVNGKKMVIK